MLWRHGMWMHVDSGHESMLTLSCSSNWISTQPTPTEPLCKSVKKNPQSSKLDQHILVPHKGFTCCWQTDSKECSNALKKSKTYIVYIQYIMYLSQPALQTLHQSYLNTEPRDQLDIIQLSKGNYKMSVLTKHENIITNPFGFVS